MVRQLADTDSPLSRDALYRHLRAGHAGSKVSFEGPTAFEAPPALSLAARIASIADSAREARTAAYASGNLFGGSRAGDAELRALLALADRLGVDHDDLQDEVGALLELATAVGQAARREPSVGMAVAARLEANRRPDIAADLRKTFPETITREVEAP